MIDIENKLYQPSAEEMITFVGNPLFSELYRYMGDTYQALKKIEYSGDKQFLGWNLKYKKAGRTLCTVYPRKGHFPLLVIVGQREKPTVEALLPSFSDAFQAAYRDTREGMGQRWLMFDFDARTPLYDDVLTVVGIRRKG